MANFSTLARPYAKAIFELAQQEKDFAGWSAVLGGLAQAVSDPKVAAAIGHPSLGRGQLGAMLIEALGDKLSPEGRNLVRLLSEYNRLKAATAIAAEYEALRAQAESRVDVEVTSAAKIGAAGQKALVAAIKKRLDREVAIEWKTDEALIGGAVIRAGDLVIDGSVRGELEKLHTALAR
ncbi:MAG: F0F1 ATP synthase subunit delta [Steroidobacteraceae bacterium]